MSKEKTGKTNAMRILDSLKISYEMQSYECDEFVDGITTADRLGIAHEFVYKTLVTVAKSRAYYVFVIPIEAELDLKAAAKAVGEKAVELLPLKDLTPVTGYVRGGCTAIGMKKVFPTVIDASVRALPYLYVSGGRPGLQLKLAVEDYLKASGATAADVIVSREE
ncbi:MAG: Cys-tRNA(Pro) deacylase [Lachnospiraceae bacterium]|nr:Cys-tRNA(Pro) deacylase [Lachnospiraceae bacterium]